MRTPVLRHMNAVFVLLSVIETTLFVTVSPRTVREIPYTPSKLRHLCET